MTASNDTQPREIRRLVWDPTAAMDWLHSIIRSGDMTMLGSAFSQLCEDVGWSALNPNGPCGDDPDAAHVALDGVLDYLRTIDHQVLDEHYEQEMWEREAWRLHGLLAEIAEWAYDAGHAALRDRIVAETATYRSSAGEPPE